jgi:hypothetical protein
MYAVTVKMDNLPRGAEVQVHGLGLLKNGSTTQVNDADAETFRQMNSTQDSHFDETTGTLVTDTMVGPTLLQAFKDSPNVTVEIVKDEPANEPAPVPTESPDTVADNTQRKSGGNS